MIGVISYLVFFATVASILSIAVLGLNLQWGNTGLFNGGVVAFFGAGAYGTLILGGTPQAGQLGGFGLPYLLALLGGMVCAGIVAWIVGLLTIRLRHDYLAIATFGVAVAFETVMRNTDALGGAQGIRGFERPLRETLGNGFTYNLAFFAFVGFEDMANVAEEVKDPLHTMPRAILWTLVLATVLYIGTTTAVLMAVPLETLSASAAPLLLVFADAPAPLQQGFSLVAIVATVNGVLIQMIMASRVLYGLADRGHLPKPLAYVSPKTQTPVVATLVVGLTILLLALTFPIDALAERTSQIVLFVFVLVNLALIRIKLAGAPADQHFRVPMAVPVLGVGTSLLLLATGLL